MMRKRQTFHMLLLQIFSTVWGKINWNLLNKPVWTPTFESIYNNKLPTGKHEPTLFFFFVLIKSAIHSYALQVDM